MGIKRGDKVRHVLTGQTMVVKKLHRSVATLKKDVPEPFTMMGIEFPGDTAICLIENLKILN